MKNVYITKEGERVELATRYVNKCDLLLDVGCGNGIIACFLKEKVNQIHGVDNSRQNLKEAKKRGLKVKNIDLDEEDLPYEDNFFDYVICLDVIEHIKEPIDLLKKIYRVLKRSGRLILSAPNIRFSNHLLRLIVNGRFPITSLDPTGYDGGHIHYFTFSDLKDLLTKVGFRIISEEGIINKPKRGVKGRILEFILGKKFMREFSSGGILIIVEK